MFANQNVDREVLIPNRVYEFVPYKIIEFIQGVTINLQGTLNIYSANHTLWPTNQSGGLLNIIQISDSQNLTLTGGGIVEGNGDSWWLQVLLTGHDGRPLMINLVRCQNVIFEDWTLRNAPSYHALLDDMLDLLVQRVTVHVDDLVLGQLKMLTEEGDEHSALLPAGIPKIWALNTDGIDIAGQRIHVRNCTIQNFDDSVCIKPLNQNSKLSTCSSDILVEDIRITYGVGASVGSVRPNTAVNCIRNVTFRDIMFDKPLKAIYIKPNPGTDGTGIIDSITYENIYAKNPLWWSIWVSTQQQAQPGNGTNTGCSFLFPLFNTTCPTQPRVPVTNLTLRNVTMVDALLSPGILRCDPAGPCTGWLFENVHFTSLTNFPLGANQGFMCESIVDPKFIFSSPTCNHDADKQEEYY